MKVYLKKENDKNELYKLYILNNILNSNCITIFNGKYHTSPHFIDILVYRQFEISHAISIKIRNSFIYNTRKKYLKSHHFMRCHRKIYRIIYKHRAGKA